MAGIHAGDPEALSLRSTFPMFTEMEKTHRSLVLGMMKRKKAQAGRSIHGPASVNVHHALGWPAATARRHCGPPQPTAGQAQLPRAIADSGRRSIQDRLDRRHMILADNVVFTTPAYVTAEIVQQLDPALAEKLRRIRYVSTSTVSLAFRSQRNHLRSQWFRLHRTRRRRPQDQRLLLVFHQIQPPRARRLRPHARLHRRRFQRRSRRARGGHADRHRSPPSCARSWGLPQRPCWLAPTGGGNQTRNTTLATAR